jgi:hypothetical protein
MFYHTCFSTNNIITLGRIPALKAKGKKSCIIYNVDVA